MSDDAERNRPKSIEKPEAGTRLSAAEIHDNVVGPARDEMERSASALLWSAFASGLTIGFSFLAGAYAQTLVDEHRYAHFAAGA
jgi:formate/nitrite transporter FocA (FNT family)